MEISSYHGRIREQIQKVLDNRIKDIDMTLKYCDEIIEEGRRQQDARLQGFGYYYKGEAFYYLNEGDDLLDNMTKALSYLSTSEEWELMTRSYNFLAIVSVNRGNIPFALDCYLNGIQCCKRFGYKDLEAIFNINIGYLNLFCEKYDEGQKYYELAIAHIKRNSKEARYHNLMLCSGVNLSKCLVFQEKYGAAKECFDKVRAEHLSYASEGEKLTLLAVEAIYYEKLGMTEERDSRIAEIDQIITGNITVMDIFDDFYDYCQMLLEAGLDEQFWFTLKSLEPMIENSKIINLRLRIVSLKMKYFKQHGLNTEYLQTAGLYYELSQAMETETRNMIYSMLNIRRSLETANRLNKEMEDENQKLVEKSEMDPLTGLGNRFRLNAFSEQAFLNAYHNRTSLTVEILDIDYFKEYNDNYGHQAGDACLLAVAGVLKALCEETGAFCARYGGDEFIIIYEGIEEAQAYHYADTLKNRIMALGIEHRFSKTLPCITISQGLCCAVPVRGKKIWDFLHAADDMLYQVKSSGRNNYGVAGLSL